MSCVWNGGWVGLDCGRHCLEVHPHASRWPLDYGVCILVISVERVVFAAIYICIFLPRMSAESFYGTLPTNYC
jgi:hypothetical protein